MLSAGTVFWDSEQPRSHVDNAPLAPDLQLHFGPGLTVDGYMEKVSTHNCGAVRVIRRCPPFLYCACVQSNIDPKPFISKLPLYGVTIIPTLLRPESRCVSVVRREGVSCVRGMHWWWQRHRRAGHEQSL